MPEDTELTLNSQAESGIVGHETQTSPESRERNPLEGAILVHGFKGNYATSDYPLPKPEWETIHQVLDYGAVVSPSRRINISPREKKRHEGVGRFDRERVCFYSLQGTGNEDIHAYVGDSCMVYPVSVLEGTIVTNDPGYPRRENIAACSETGIEIPLQKGILLITKTLFYSLESKFRDYAKKLGISYEELIQRHIKIVEPDVLKNSQDLYEEAQRYVKPSSGVILEPLDVKGFDIDWHTGKTAKLEDLGDGKLLT